jgi:hypothetical protein
MIRFLRKLWCRVAGHPLYLPRTREAWAAGMAWCQICKHHVMDRE